MPTTISRNRQPEGSPFAQLSAKKRAPQRSYAEQKLAKEMQKLNASLQEVNEATNPTEKHKKQTAAMQQAITINAAINDAVEQRLANVTPTPNPQADPTVQAKHDGMTFRQMLADVTGLSIGLAVGHQLLRKGQDYVNSLGKRAEQVEDEYQQKKAAATVDLQQGLEKAFAASFSEAAKANPALNNQATELQLAFETFQQKLVQAVAAHAIEVSKTTELSRSDVVAMMPAALHKYSQQHALALVGDSVDLGNRAISTGRANIRERDNHADAVLRETVAHTRQAHATKITVSHTGAAITVSADGTAANAAGYNATDITETGGQNVVSTTAPASTYTTRADVTGGNEPTPASSPYRNEGTQQTTQQQQSRFGCAPAQPGVAQKDDLVERVEQSARHAVRPALAG